jgi:acyl-CoA synthetase (AMP-forming)/AMP-acid ligase II
MLKRTEPDETLGALLARRAEEAPDARAYAFLADGGAVAREITHAGLDAAARRVAGALRARAAPGDRALIAFPAGIDMLAGFFGCLYAGLVPVPAPPPEASRRKRTLPRLMSILDDAGIKVILSSGDVTALLRDLAADSPALAALDILDIAEAEGADPVPPVAGDPGAIAYLQYTSGSTTTPKGVMLTHRNVQHHCRDLRAELGYDAESASLTWLPYYHDYGLVEGLLAPLQNGTPAYILSPFSFLKRPVGWLDAMSRHRCTHTQAPNFAYDQCVRRLRPGQAEAMDLSHVVSMGNGAEPVNAEVLERFHAAFAPAGLRREALCPAYGLAEATLMMTCRRPGEAPRVLDVDAAALRAGRAVPAAAGAEGTLPVVSCGRPMGAVEVAIVDPDTAERLPEGAVGEIWIRDAAVAEGYWRRPEDSAALFRARLSDSGEGPFLRTGDLGFLEGGELFVTSRLKDLIIVAGQNHAPQDIEWSVERCHDAIRPQGVAAAALTGAGEERLVVVAETERGAVTTPEAAQEIVAAIRRACTEGHDLPAHAVLLMRRGSLPKTASGKIRRHACADLVQAPGPDALAHWIAGMAAPAMAADTMQD